MKSTRQVELEIEKTEKMLANEKRESLLLRQQPENSLNLRMIMLYETKCLVLESRIETFKWFLED